MNAPVLIRFICDSTAQCPVPATIDFEGGGQVVSSTAIDSQGRETTTETVVNLDLTGPDVAIQSPADGSVTTASSVRVMARAFDPLSGVASATCNGRSAPVAATGVIECVVTLAPGANDVVVEASDLADNSASAGFRITRIGKPSALRIVPDELSVLVGRQRTLQVVDEFWRDVPDVVWRVDNYRLLEISQDGTHLVTPKAPGVVTVTAIHNGLSVDARITVYAGKAFPPQAVAWKLSVLSVIQTPDTPPREPDSSEGLRHYVFQPRAKRPALVTMGELTGRLSWIVTPAVDDSEQVNSMASHRLGGGVLVVESSDGSSSLVRSGPSALAPPWRYRARGRLSDKLVQDVEGKIVVVETGPDYFPRVLIFDGRTGRIRQRLQLEPGISVMLNVACIAHANAAREIPPEMGPAMLLPDGSLTFEMLQAQDLEDFGLCGSVSGYFRRVLQVATMSANGPAVQAIGQYEVFPGSSPPRVTMFRIVSDGRGGKVVPWTVQYSDSPPEPHVSRLAADGGRQDFVVPVAAEIVVLGQDLGAMCDGTTLAVFHLLTGEVKWSRIFPKGGARILPAPLGKLIVVHPQALKFSTRPAAAGSRPVRQQVAADMLR